MIGTFVKAQFREYTDSSFKVAHMAAGRHSHYTVMSQHGATWSLVGYCLSPCGRRCCRRAAPQTLKKRDPQWDHLGNLGPAVYGSVGQVIRIVFRNNLVRLAIAFVARKEAVLSW